MTDPVERYIMDAFRDDASRAPSPGSLARDARSRAGIQRRRNAAVMSGTFTAVAVMVSVSAVMWGPWKDEIRIKDDGSAPAIVARQPNFSGPLTREECPKDVNVGGQPFIGNYETQPPAEDQARRLGRIYALEKHPDAMLVAGPATATRKEFYYVLPNGNRVAVIMFELIRPYGWYLYGSAHC